MTDKNANHAFGSQNSTQDLIKKYKNELLSIYKANNPTANVPNTPVYPAPITTAMPPPVTDAATIPKASTAASVPSQLARPRPAAPPVQAVPEADHGYGFLQLEVTIGKSAIPLENAFVTFLKGENEVRSVLRFCTTDASGETPLIPIPATQKPASGQPYTTCNVTVTADGYHPVEKRHIPVYAGIKTIQAVEMVPLVQLDECLYKPDFSMGTLF